MIEYDLAVLAGVAVDAWLVALVALRGRRPWLQATFAALGLTLIVNGAAFLGVDSGLLPGAWGDAVFATLVLLYPLSAILVLGLIHGESLPRRRAAIFLLLVAVPVVLVLVSPADRTALYAYDLNPLGGFLGLCLGIALAECVYQRMTSALYGSEAEWLIVALLVLIVGGPVYSLEFASLGLPVAEGANLMAPVSLALFAAVALRSAPYPAPARRGDRARSGEGEVVGGAAIVFEERRPAYALGELRQEALGGRPTLLIARSSAPVEDDRGVLAIARVEPSRFAAARTLATASEFLSRFPRGLVGILDVGDIALLSGWAPTLEAVRNLRTVAKETKGTVIVGAACLTRVEQEDLRPLKMTWWTLPDPTTEVEAILSRSFGPGAGPLLARFAAEAGLRPADLTPECIPDLTRFLDHAILAPGVAVADHAAAQALRSQTQAAEEGLRAFASRSPANLADGNWPSKNAAPTEPDMVVTADAFWKGREAEAETMAQAATRPSFYDQALAVFTEAFGPGGEAMLRSELSKLGRKPQDLRAQDVGRLADRAAVDLAAMADVVDVPQEKARIKDQIESIRRRLEAIAGVES